MAIIPGYKNKDGQYIPTPSNILEDLKKIEKPDLKVTDYSLVVNDKIKIEIVKNDITKENVDAITNAANGSLLHGGGVAGAISNCGGPDIQKESSAYVRKNGKIPTGGAGQTSGGKMACKYVIHTVGPIYSQYTPETSEELLRASILSTLTEARTL